MIEKLQSVFVIAAMFAGLALGRLTWVSQNASHFILLFLTLMLCGVFLQIPLTDLRAAFQNYKPTGLSLGMNFLWTPVFAWGLGAIFLADAPDLWVGLIMLMVTPCTDWYLIFTDIAKGNVALGTALLPWNLALQIILLPIYLLIFAGTLVGIDAQVLFESVLLVLIVPMGVAFAARRWLERAQGRPWLEGWLLPKIALGQLVFLDLAIIAMFASQGTVLMQQPHVFVKLLPPVALFFAGNFGLGHLVGRVFGLPYRDLVTFCCTTLARNSPIALAIAVMAFPERPLIALALVIGPLIELPILGVVSQTLLFMHRQGLVVRSGDG